MQSDLFLMNDNVKELPKLALYFYAHYMSLPRKGLYFSENTIDNENHYRLYLYC